MKHLHSTKPLPVFQITRKNVQVPSSKQSKLHPIHQNPTFPLPFSLLNPRTISKISNPAIDFVLDEIQQQKSSEQITQFPPDHKEPIKNKVSKELSGFQISHPWPEWVELMEHLIHKGYFRPDEIGNMGGNGKEYNLIRTACLKFARDQVDLIRYFSRKDIQVLAGAGCPSVDRKVVNSGKRLREHTGIDEGNVCGSCTLRGNCERAYMKAHNGEGVNSVDVMRLLVTYGLDLTTSSVDNKSCLNKNVLKSVRRLSKEMMEFSVKEPLETISLMRNSPVQGNSTHQAKEQINSPMKQGNWMCPKCNFINSSRNVKCEDCKGSFRERPSELGENQDHLQKKGDWICYKCNFLNFAKNTRCLHCKEKPPKRQLNPGEWECDSCNYINFRRNMICMKCDHKRRKASYNTQQLAKIASDGGR